MVCYGSWRSSARKDETKQQRVVLILVVVVMLVVAVVVSVVAVGSAGAIAKGIKRTKKRFNAAHNSCSLWWP